MVQADDPNHEVFTTEYFGPILGVFVYDDADYDQVLRESAAIGPYGLTGSIIAQDRTVIVEAMDALRFAAGNFYINDKPTGAVVGQQPLVVPGRAGLTTRPDPSSTCSAGYPSHDQGNVRGGDRLPLSLHGMTVTEYGPTLPVRAYNSVWQLRGDAWSSLADATKRLVEASLPADQSDTLRKEVASLLQLLDPIESYWAYPGREQLHQIREMCEDDDYEAAMRIADTVSRHLVRHETAGRPVFEVLIVDDISTAEAEALREELQLAACGGPLHLRARYRSQLRGCPRRGAAQLRPAGLRHTVGPAVSSAHRLDDLRHFFESIGDLGSEPQSANERMLLLGKRIADRRPEMDLYLVAKVSIEHIAGRLTRQFRRIFHRQDSLELHLSILAGVADRYETPFFTAPRL